MFYTLISIERKDELWCDYIFALLGVCKLVKQKIDEKDGRKMKRRDLPSGFLCCTTHVSVS